MLRWCRWGYSQYKLCAPCDGMQQGTTDRHSSHNKCAGLSCRSQQCAVSPSTRAGAWPASTARTRVLLARRFDIDRREATRHPFVQGVSATKSPRVVGVRLTICIEESVRASALHDMRGLNS